MRKQREPQGNDRILELSYGETRRSSVQIRPAPPLAFHHRDKFMACFKQKARATTLNMRKGTEEFAMSYREEAFARSDFSPNALVMIFLPCLMKINARQRKV